MKITKETLKIAKINNDLNEQEINVLLSLLPSSESNGHDFGFTDEYEDIGFSKHQMAGYIGSLAKKGYISVYDDSQFEFTERGFKLLNELVMLSI